MCERPSIAMLACGLLATAALAAGPTYTDPDKTDADFPYQGEYVGKVKSNDGDVTVGLQIIALGKGKFHAVGYHGGLPGEGWDKETRHEADGELTTVGRYSWVMMRSPRSRTAWRRSPPRTEPSSASSTTSSGQHDAGDAAGRSGGAVRRQIGRRLQRRKMTEDGRCSKAEPASKFRQLPGSSVCTPYQPEDRAVVTAGFTSARGTMPDARLVGLKGEKRVRRALFSKAPDVNMCLLPLSWQTYDIDTLRWRGGQAGRQPAGDDPHNGVVIHKDVELPGEADDRRPEQAWAELDQSTSRITATRRYRNIWVVEKK
jgi:hypothetical protein